MSPEVCESKPYTYKSDVWALGIILYELCNLDRPFYADNLLGLVYKIVSSEPAPIDDTYSDDLKSIVKLLLKKNPDERPSIIDLLKIPYARDKMDQFVKNGGLTHRARLSVRKVKK